MGVKNRIDNLRLLLLAMAGQILRLLRVLSIPLVMPRGKPVTFRKRSAA